MRILDLGKYIDLHECAQGVPDTAWRRHRVGPRRQAGFSDRAGQSGQRSFWYMPIQIRCGSPKPRSHLISPRASTRTRTSC
ncbi:hypothetical protein DB30_05237 [Enhygromyxa salina]|uniref:Uncharacterized protein n=1 Tax=Enhygromyxa salina TaxID=215803 RepID=A0A0C1ZDU7_9BACT|nr:hypothetical protein DB30_05237 [Enhygromyxa salina]